eukprot:scaffold31888_cov62-Attheya_sp.AAC.2
MALAGVSWRNLFHGMLCAAGLFGGTTLIGSIAWMHHLDDGATNTSNPPFFWMFGTKNENDAAPTKNNSLVFVVGLPRTGTFHVHSYFSCGGVESVVHGYLAKKKGAKKAEKCGYCVERNMRWKRPPLEHCGDYDSYDPPPPPDHTGTGNSRTKNWHVYSECSVMEWKFVGQYEHATCFLPQVEALHAIHQHYPHATFLLTTLGGGTHQNKDDENVDTDVVAGQLWANSLGTDPDDPSGLANRLLHCDSDFEYDDEHDDVLPKLTYPRTKDDLVEFYVQH